MTYKVKKFRPRLLGYNDSKGKYHGPYMVTGSKCFKPIKNVSKQQAHIIAKARNKISQRKKGKCE